MRRIRSMLVPVRGQIRKRSKRVPFPEMGAWLPWIRSPDAEIDQFRDRLATRLRKQAGLETSESKFLADGHTDDEWQELLANREREVQYFHKLGLRPVFIEGARVPSMKEGEVIRSVWAEAPSSTLSRDAGLVTLLQEIDLLKQTAPVPPPNSHKSESPRQCRAEHPLARFFRATLRLLRAGLARPLPPAQAGCPAREGLASGPSRPAWRHLLVGVPAACRALGFLRRKS